MSKEKASDTCSVRVPPGTAEKVRAATGQPFSRVVRWTVLALLDKYEKEQRQRRNEGYAAISDIVKEQVLPDNLPE